MNEANVIMIDDCVSNDVWHCLYVVSVFFCIVDGFLSQRLVLLMDGHDFHSTWTFTIDVDCASVSTSDHSNIPQSKYT